VTGPTAVELDRLIRRYAVTARGICVLGLAPIGLLVVPDANLPWALVWAGVLVAWNLVWTVLVLRGSLGWPVVVDVLLIGAVAINEAGLVPGYAVADGTGWVMALVSVSVVAYQWCTTPRRSAVA
jgi:hypothetical protein